MPYFVEEGDLHRIYLKDFDNSDHWFDIPELQSHHDRIVLDQAIADIVDQDDQRTVRPRRERQFDLLIRTLVKAWSFTDKQGNPIPINEKSVVKLEHTLGEWMAEQIDAHYNRQKRSEGYLKNSESGRSAGTSVVELSPENWHTSS